MSKTLMSPRDPRYVANDDIWTPKWVFDQLNCQFDLDVASSPLSTHVPAHHKYTEVDDGLTSPWFGRVWMNPPYSNPTPWVEKWREHANGLAFLPTPKALWFMNLWHDSRVSIAMFNKHMKFVKPDNSTHGIFMNTVLVSIGEGNRKYLENLQNVFVR